MKLLGAGCDTCQIEIDGLQRCLKGTKNTLVLAGHGGTAFRDDQGIQTTRTSQKRVRTCNRDCKVSITARMLPVESYFPQTIAGGRQTSKSNPDSRSGLRVTLPRRVSKEISRKSKTQAKVVSVAKCMRLPSDRSGQTRRSCAIGATRVGTLDVKLSVGASETVGGAGKMSNWLFMAQRRAQKGGPVESAWQEMLRLRWWPR